MSSTVRYKMPGAGEYVVLKQEQPPMTLQGLEEISERLFRSGQPAGPENFVISPYSVASEEHAVVLMHPDVVLKKPLPPNAPPCRLAPVPRHEDRSAYEREFRLLQKRLQGDRLKKVVLSRRAETSAGDYTPEELFLRACHIYPDCYVCLFDTPQTGCWLTATPELLLGGCGAQWETMALAGTLTQQGESLQVEDFGTKNLREQTLVKDYILRTLAPFSQTVEVQAREVRRMGRIAHLCTPVRFRTDNPFTRIGACLGQLHPTPAVCGEPRAEAQAALSQLDSCRERRYYAGFTGPVSANSAALYVTLRAMCLHDGCAHLYAGGGLLPESDVSAEWDETCRKMETIERILYDRL